MRTSTSSTRARLVPAGLLTAGAVGAALLVAPQAAFAATTAVPAIGPASGTVAVTDSAASFTASTLAAQFNAASTCPSTAAAAGTSVFAATVAKTDNSNVTVTVPTTLAFGTNGVPKEYKICFYTAAAAGSAQIATNSVPTYTAYATSTVSPASGASGGGNTITVTAPTAAPYFTGVTSPTSVFSTSTCAGTLPGSPASNLVGTVTRSTATATANTVATIAVPSGVLGTGTTAAAYNACIYNSSTNALLASVPYSVTLPAITLSQSSGPVATSQNPVNLTFSSTSNFLASATNPMAVFTTATTCPTTYGSSPSNAVPVRKAAANRGGVGVPGITVGSYLMCVYAGADTTSKVLAAAAYTVNLVATATSITPSSGPALGNATITVMGSNFPTTAGAITATLGGQALTGITPIDANSFTATTPSHTSGPVSLVITTSNGSTTLQNAYTYVNSIAVSPNTATQWTAAQDLDVTGTGFLNYSFPTSTSTATDSTDSHVYLVAGKYNPADTGSGDKANGPVVECANVLVIGDNELFCTVNLTTALNSAGTAIASGYRALTDAVTTASSNQLTSALGAFTQADVGKPLVESGSAHVAAGTVIAAVLDSQTVVMSKPSVSAGTSLAVGVGTTRTASSLTASGNTLTGTFTQADVGKAVAATNVGSGGVNLITAVNSAGTSATLAKATTGTVTSATITTANTVPAGAYVVTIVSNGAADANTTDTDYVQTAISSSATFTVADF